MNERSRLKGRRLWAPALLLACLIGCVVNPVPTPGSATNAPPSKAEDSEQREKDSGGRNFDGTADASSGASDDAMDPAGAVTGTDAVGGDAGDGDDATPLDASGAD